jgi:hypothetical protein
VGCWWRGTTHAGKPAVRCRGVVGVARCCMLGNTCVGCDHMVGGTCLGRLLVLLYMLSGSWQLQDVTPRGYRCVFGMPFPLVTPPGHACVAVSCSLVFVGLTCWSSSRQTSLAGDAWRAGVYAFVHEGSASTGPGCWLNDSLCSCLQWGPQPTCAHTFCRAVPGSFFGTCYCCLPCMLCGAGCASGPVGGVAVCCRSTVPANPMPVGCAGGVPCPQPLQLRV